MGTLARAWRSLFVLGVGNYGALATGLVVNVVITRRLGTEHYGRMALMLMASQLLLFLSVNWTHTGFVRFGSRSTRFVSLKARLPLSQRPASTYSSACRPR